MAGDAVPDAAGQPDGVSQRGAGTEDPASHPNLALYRKYRPATFAEVKGQEHVTEPLRRALAHGRVHHAYLFSGPRGCGKTSSARILARSLNCEQGPTPDPCGVCESCVALAPNGPGSIDVIEIDAASHGGVDDARDLRERAFYAPVSGHFKIYIIDEAHMVTREGFNALLKLVEEPPPHLKFVFATTEPDKVVSTIRSRTHHYPFRLVPPPVLRELLEEVLASEGVSYEPPVLPVVIRAGAGSVRDTLSVLDQLLAGSGEAGIRYADAVTLLGYTDAGLLDEVVDAFAAGDGSAVFRAVDRAVQAGHDPRRFAADLLDRLRDLIVLGAVEDAARTGLLDAPADQLDRMREQAAKFGVAELTRAAEVLNAGLTEMRGATSPRLLLELTCARVLLPAADAGEAALLARLERLERAAGQDVAAQAAAGAAAAAPAEQEAPAAGRAPSARGTSSETAVPRRTKPAASPAASAAGRQAAAGPGPASPGQAPTAQAPRGQGPSGHGAPVQGPPGQGPPGQGPPGQGPPGQGGRANGGPADGGPGQRPGGRGEGRPGEAPGRGEPAADRPRAAEPAGGGVTAESLRNGWDAVLDAVKKRRRVSWILLSSVTVRSLEAGTLTLEFAREGELKTFSSSGHDAVLSDVLNELYGVKWRIAPVAAARNPQESPGLAASRADQVTERVTGGPGAVSGTGPGGSRGAGAGAGPDGSGGAGPGDPGNADPRENRGAGQAPGASGPGRDAGPAGNRGSAGPGAAGPGAAGPGGAGPGGAGPGGAGPGAAGPGGAGPGHPGASGGRGAPPSGAAGSRAQGRAGAQPPPAVRLDTPPADDEADPRGDADADAEVTGMELIQRELGGQIIGEIEDS